MNKSRFLFEDKIKEIQTSFIKDGWVTIYYNQHDDKNDECLIYCCVVKEDYFKKYKENRDWGIQIGSEGRPSVYGDGTYKSFDNEGIEPFIYSKRFTFAEGYDNYIDLSEEFILYFKLYETLEDKKNRKYFFIDDTGDLDEVISITPSQIRIKQKYLMEYISVRKLYFSICFDFMRFSKTSLCEPIDKDFQTEKYYFNHYVRALGTNKFQSWIHGKVFIPYNENGTKSYHFDFENREYEKYIIGYDENGNEMLESCKKTNDKYFALTYFKKEVLDKYYNEPSKYRVDGFSVSSNFIYLKIDNNLSDYVPVFLVELGILPHKEQLHWKQYNIQPQKGISRTYYKTMIEGSWAEHPETPDLFFKQRFYSFNKNWKAKFGWDFYKPLAKNNIHYLDGLHIPTNNNIKAFCQQILALVIITIDSLNEKEIGKNIDLETNDKGINKLDKFLKSKDIDLPKMIEFLKQLQNLRSGLVAHRFSESNKNTRKAIQYFGINNDNYIEVANDIFIKSIYTLNTMESQFEIDK